VQHSIASAANASVGRTFEWCDDRAAMRSRARRDIPIAVRPGHSRMTHHTALHARALAAIPDTPVTVETRALAQDAATIVHAIGDGWLLIAAQGDLACVFGAVDPVALDAILDVAAFDGDLLLPETGTVTPAMKFVRWKAERALIFTANAAASAAIPAAASPMRPATVVRRLSPRDDLGHVPAHLRDELECACATREVFAAFCDGTPVSFAYVSLATERHGDLSIDTLDAFRRRGFGAAALRPVIAGLLARGMHPVWGAIESNGGSLALARSLGFTQPAGTLWIASRRRA